LPGKNTIPPAIFWPIEPENAGDCDFTGRTSFYIPDQIAGQARNEEKNEINVISCQPVVLVADKQRHKLVDFPTKKAGRGEMI